MSEREALSGEERPLSYQERKAQVRRDFGDVPDVVLDVYGAEVTEELWRMRDDGASSEDLAAFLDWATTIGDYTLPDQPVLETMEEYYARLIMDPLRTPGTDRA